MVAEECIELLENGGSSEDSESSEEFGACRWADWFWWFLQFLIDLAASVPLWYAMFTEFPDRVVYSFLATVGLLMILWRIYRAYCEEKTELGQSIPYTCAHAHADGRDLFLVATVHISPRAPKDVWRVIRSTNPSVAMIELDEERLNRMRQVPRIQEMTQEQVQQALLQPVTFRVAAEGTAPPLEISSWAQRAVWNTQAANEQMCGEVVFRPEDEYGQSLDAVEADSGDSEDFMALIRKPPKEMLEGQLAPFTTRAYEAAKSGASALLVVNWEENLPVHKIGMTRVWDEIRYACTTGNCALPSVPLLLLRQECGEQLIRLRQSGRKVTAQFKVKEDGVRPRSLPKKLCQECALIFSGIGILYGIIQCFSVRVGAEFLAADSAARDLGIRCVCIDVDLDRFWSKLGWAVLPTPCNLLNSLMSWIAFPRILFQFLFPPFGAVDALGSTLLHLGSFSCRVWISFVLAGLCASLVTSSILRLFSSGVEVTAESAGVVEEVDRSLAQTYIILAIEMYLLPQIYDAVAASRDESMYQSMVRKCKDFAAERFVVVVGAGHANGILQRVRQHGL